MQAAMLHSTVTRPVVVTARSGVPTSTRPVARRGLIISNSLIGQVNDPERSKGQIKDKQNESSWAQPKNSNPVEKRQAGHDTEPAVEEAGQAAEKAKQSVVDTAKQAREAVEKLTKKGDE